MAGRNQHHIPRFLQRGFAIAGSDGHKIWRFDKERRPTAPCSIRSTASENDFYSEPALDGSRTLDDEITDMERPVVEALSTLRSAKVGTLVQAEVASELVSHFVPRTAHCRQIITRGMRQAAAGAAALFTESSNLQALLGLNQSTPNDVFRSRVGNELRKNKAIASLALPGRIIERIAFYITKEQFDADFEQNIKQFMYVVSRLIDGIGSIARRSHNKALIELDSPNARRDVMQAMNWQIIPSPQEGAILPDCVALALDHAGEVLPFILAKVDDTAAVVMPLSTKVLLLGVRGDVSLPTDFDYNREAARSSHRFFLAGTNDAAFFVLRSLIDEYPARTITDAVSHALCKYINVFSGPDEDSSDNPQLIVGSPPSVAATSWRYQLSFLGCADEATANKISTVAKQLIDGFAQELPLSRLDGITFASDYAAALREVDGGMPGLTPPTTIDRNIGIGIAQTVNVVRDGVVTCRIVMDSAIAHALITEDERRADRAIGVLAQQLAHVALVQIIDKTLPGMLLRPILDPMQRWLYGTVGGAIKEYVAVHISAGFGDPEERAENFRYLLADALDRMRAEILPARLAYRYHGVLDDLLVVTMPLVRHVLVFAAGLLGHCAATGMEPVPPGSALAEALDRAGLRRWLPRYYADLEAFRLRLGQWESFDEFFVFNVHVERLMWQLGMIPWSSDEGIRVEVPIGTDAEELMVDLAGAALKPK